VKTRLIFAVILVLMLAGCATDADVASRNLSTQADQFQIVRRIVFYNGITNDYILTIEGRCSLGNYDANRELSVTCKTGPDQFKKHFLGLSDNVTYFAEQLESTQADVYHYKIIFKPTTIIPDIDLSIPKGD
jgi:hypothetical protein